MKYPRSGMNSANWSFLYCRLTAGASAGSTTARTYQSKSSRETELGNGYDLPLMTGALLLF
jgi:hypothetical protein